MTRTSLEFGGQTIRAGRRKTRGGSIRAVATKKKKKVFLFEGGEASRFDEPIIETGRYGVEELTPVSEYPVT